MPALHTASQTHRLSTLLAWAQAGRPFSARDVMEAFSVSLRTARRDLDRLRDDWRVPLEWDARRGTYVATEPIATMAPLPLSAHEFAALLVAHHALDALGDAASAEVLQGAMDRLAAALPPSVQVPVAALVHAVRFAPPAPRPRAAPGWQLRLVEAIEAQQVVAIRYRSASKDEPTERRVEPYLVVQHGGRWYLVGYCHLRDAWRDFRLDRIEALETTPATFTPRPFDADAYLGEGLGMHRGDRTYHVHLRFSARQARWVAEEHYHETQVLARLPDGRLDLRLSVKGLPDLVRWVLGYGAEVEVLSPAVLRAEVASAHRAAVDLYRRDAPPSPN